MKHNSKDPHSNIILISFIVPLILQLALFIYQLCNKVVSIWNIFATGMMLGIFINAVRMSRKTKPNIVKDPDIVTGGSTIDHSKTYQEKQSKKAVIIKLISALLALGLSILLFNIHNNKSNGLELVNSKVISQWGDKTVETENTEDGVTTTESEHIEVLVEYEYNGVTKQAKITGGTTNKIYVDELKIYIDQNGKFVSDYGRIFIWKIEAIIFLFAAIMLLLTAIFSLGIEFIAGTIFTSAGLAIFFVIGCQFIENLWFNDLSCFMTLFVNIGIYMLLVGILNLIFPKKNDQEPIIEPESLEESMSNLKKRLKLKHNKNSQNSFKQPNEFLTKNHQCKNCGAPMSKSHKFCTNCGSKRD